MKLTFLATIMASSLSAQFTITGPDCVKPGIVYQYEITRGGGDSSGYFVCVQGGNVRNISDSCVSFFTGSMIRVIWKTVSVGIIRVRSGNGTRVKAVHISSELEGGEILPMSRRQLITQGTVPDTIKCSSAMYGNCSAVYSYQWEQSFNKITWENIAGAVVQHLKLQTVVMEPTYYRRKVRETGSGTIIYSGIADVFVIPVAR